MKDGLRSIFVRDRSDESRRTNEDVLSCTFSFKCVFATTLLVLFWSIDVSATCFENSDGSATCCAMQRCSTTKPLRPISKALTKEELAKRKLEREKREVAAKKAKESARPKAQAEEKVAEAYRTSVELKEEKRRQTLLKIIEAQEGEIKRLRLLLQKK